MLKLFKKSDVIWGAICIIMMTLCLVGSRIYNEVANERVYRAMASYMNRTDSALIQLYDLAKEYEAIIKRCKCTQI